MAQVPKPMFFFKGFPEDVRFRSHTVPDSLEYARGTLYEAWFNAVKLSPYLAKAWDMNDWPSTQAKKVGEQFGDLRNISFEQWWLEKGYSLFAEGRAFAKICVDDGSKTTSADSMWMEIPLTVSPQTLRRQFDQLLRDHHPHFKDFDRWKASTSIAPMQNKRLTSVSINLYLDVYKCWIERGGMDKEVHLYEVGEQLRLNPKFIVEKKDLHSDVQDKHLGMSLLVSEYLEKGKNLVAHASEGIFPYTDNHDWIPRRTRAQHSRFE
jgi:hypothetical protein